MPDTARMATLRWRFNRLRCMDSAEVLHRLARLFSIYTEQLLHSWSKQAPVADIRGEPAPWIHGTSDIDKAPYLAAADRLVAGKFDIFSLHDIDLGAPPCWNRDPLTGIEAPRTFGKLLDYRNQQLVGDIKYLWEPNRHLHLVTLAQAYALSGNLRYLSTLQEHLESWFTACPPGIGPNWASALEPALRLINWSLAWQLIGGSDSPAFAGSNGSRFQQQWLAAIHHHAQFVGGHLSQHSSANNHLIGEVAGLFIAGVAWPHWPQAEGWRKTAQKILIREALLQNAPDGVNREQATSYVQFELDLLLLPLLAGRANGIDFPASYAARIEAMMEFLASIMDSGGHVPMIGDADDGRVVQLTPATGFCNYQSLLATGAVLFERADFKAKAGVFDDKTRWLLGPTAATTFTALPEKSALAGRLPVCQAFKDGGYYILGRDFESKDEIRLVVDAGALGYQGIAAHGHADALAFTLSIGGQEFLIDPGTYAYHTKPAWRAYFRGTAAHNTVRVDERDQSESGGNFMWLNKAKAGCHTWLSGPDQDLFEGWHDGYQRLTDPVRHTRRITLDKQTGRIVIDDTLQMTGTHVIELFFHCDEHTRLSATGDSSYQLSQEGRTIRIQLPVLPGMAGVTGATEHIHCGSTQPMAGWVSRRFDVRQPAPTLHWRAQLHGTTSLRTVITC